MDDPTEGMTLVKVKETCLGRLIMWMSDAAVEFAEKNLQGNVEIYANDQFDKFLRGGRLDKGVLVLNSNDEEPERIQERELLPQPVPYEPPSTEELAKEVSDLVHQHIERSYHTPWRYEDMETQPIEGDILVFLNADGKPGNRASDRVLCIGSGVPNNRRPDGTIWEAPVKGGGRVVLSSTNGRGWRILKRVPEHELEPVGTMPVVGDEVCAPPTPGPDELEGAYSFHCPTTVRSVNVRKNLVEMDSQIEGAEEKLDATLIAYFMEGKFRVLKRKFEPLETQPLAGDTMRNPETGEEHKALEDGEQVQGGLCSLWHTKYSDRGGLVTFRDGTGWRIVKRKHFLGKTELLLEPLGTTPVKGDRVVCIYADEKGTRPRFIRTVKEVTKTEAIASKGDGAYVGYDLQGFTREGMPGGMGNSRFRILKRSERDFERFDPEKGTMVET